MDIDKFFNEYSMAYQMILKNFKQTNKLKKVSYSTGDKRYCFLGYIENGILKVKLKKIHTNPNFSGRVANGSSVSMSF